jgi:hypothetical protein
VLPFIEEQALYDMGRGTTGPTRVALLQKRDSTPVAIMNCPSRRSGGPYPRVGGGDALSGNGTGLAGRYPMTQPARGDYAVNVGDETDFDGRCLDIAPDQYNAPRDGRFPPSSDVYSGVSFCGTAVKLRQITDGLSKTIALGERWIPAPTYENNQPWGADDWGMYVGFQDDTVRSTFYDGRDVSHVPIADTTDVRSIKGVTGIEHIYARELFGSVHPGGCIFSRCDGSADLIAFDIDPEMFRQMGDRRDGGIIKVYSRRGG